CQSSAWTTGASMTPTPHSSAIRLNDPIILFLIVEDPGSHAAVICSSQPRILMASSRSLPHTSTSALKPPQTAGRSGLPNSAQRLSRDRCRQRSPAGLPLGIPGIGELMEGAIQQAPQPSRQFMTTNSSEQNGMKVLG